MIKLFSKKDPNLQYDCLLNFDKESDLYKEITNFQNNISVLHSTKVIGVSSFDNTCLSVAFAKALASAYAFNEESTIIIDVDLYCCKLKEILKITGEEESVINLNDKIDCLFFKKEAYPSNIYKTGFISNILKKYSNLYDHIIFVAPNLEEHTDILLFGNSLNCLLVPVKKNGTEKKLIYNEIHFFELNGFPLPEFVILK